MQANAGAPEGMYLICVLGKSESMEVDTVETGGQDQQSLEVGTA